MGDRPAISVATRLRSAIITNDLLLVKRILRNNPTYLQNPNFDDNGNTSLHLAAIMGHLEIIVRLASSLSLSGPGFNFHVFGLRRKLGLRG